jgi:chloramphenicol 3-O phosphotransferase
MIIFINGPSSSGKTLLARALQERWKDPLIYLSLDAVISHMPFAFTGFGPRAEEGFGLRRTECRGELRTVFCPGFHGRRLNELEARYAALIAVAGYDLVIDYVLADLQMLQPFEISLASERVLFLGLSCDSSTLAARQGKRGDRTTGLAESQLESVPLFRDLYDLELDSTNRAAEDLANDVLTYIETHQISIGFRR